MNNDTINPLEFLARYVPFDLKFELFEKAWRL
jgi:hypothetical protein